MNESERQLVDLYLDGELPEAESAALLARLEKDPQAVAYLAERSLLLSDLRRSVKRRNLQHWAVASTANSEVQRGSTTSGASRWLRWRPLAAAAAGLVIGVFSTTVVFGYVMPQMVKALTLLRESFEGDEGKQRAAGFPTTAGVWGGDAAGIVSTGDAVRAKEGARMLRLEPVESDMWNRQHFIIDLCGLPPAREDEARTVRVTASFHASDSEIRDRYLMRAATFSEGPGEIDPMWMHKLWGDVSNRALSAAAQARTFPPGAAEWQTMHLTLDVPPGSRVLVVSLWAATMDGRPEHRAAHYLDDIQVTLAPLAPAP